MTIKNLTQLCGCVYKKVFTKKIYLFFVLLSALIVLWISVSLPNIKIMMHLPDTFTFGERVRVLISSFGMLTTNFRMIDQIFIVLISLLAGINIALTLYQMRHRAKNQRASGAGLLGTMIALFGIGCSACGSLILASFLGVGAAASITRALPLHGSEFALLGIAILLAVTFYTMKKIARPKVC